MQQADDFGDYEACRTRSNKRHRGRLAGKVTPSASVAAELTVAQILFSKTRDMCGDANSRLAIARPLGLDTRTLPKS